MFYHNDCHMRHCSKHFVMYSRICYELIVAGSSIDMSCSHCGYRVYWQFIVSCMSTLTCPSLARHSVDHFRDNKPA